jgi:hypothetical protein
MNGAAFLANKRHFELFKLQPYYNINWDLGSEIMVPDSNLAGVAVASLFLGLYVLVLFALVCPFIAWKYLSPLDFTAGVFRHVPSWYRFRPEKFHGPCYTRKWVPHLQTPPKRQSFRRSSGNSPLHRNNANQEVYNPRWSSLN